MSFSIVLYVREGIVMAGDSRVALNATTQQGESQVVNVAVAHTDSVYKTFLAPKDVGIAACGEPIVQGMPIAGFVDSFIAEQLGDWSHEVDAVPELLIAYFNALPEAPNATFLVAGYATVEGARVPRVYRVRVQTGEVSLVNTPEAQIGATWEGEGDVLQRLLYPVWVQDGSDSLQQVPHHDWPMQFFTLQDAVDFATFALRTTIDAIRFQARPKVVGGPIDVLVIKPDGAQWVQKKSLHP
jgi:hypothetical protein